DPIRITENCFTELSKTRHEWSAAKNPEASMRVKWDGQNHFVMFRHGNALNALTKSKSSHTFRGLPDMVQSHEWPSISVVTPVYNGEASIGELCRRLAEVLPRISAQHEVILVNDGSRDRSWEVISELCSRAFSVRGLNLMRNYGQHNA